ncbi:unnamed protein product [Cochlearia groenlandica]
MSETTSQAGNISPSRYYVLATVREEGEIEDVEEDGVDDSTYNSISTEEVVVDTMLVVNTRNNAKISNETRIQENNSKAIMEATLLGWNLATNDTHRRPEPERPPLVTSDRYREEEYQGLVSLTRDRYLSISVTFDRYM